MSTGWNLSSDSPLLAAAGQGRGRVRFSVDQPLLQVSHGRAGAAEPAERLLAGAVDVDITPPPGIPKAGYSRNAHDGAGFRTRLRARVLHLRSGSTSIALVQCDLLGGSAVLHHLVAKAVAERTDVPLAGLMIGATHTHGGPGQFLGTGFYNRYASNKAGFDAAWAQFLAERIAEGVASAVDTRRPAQLAVGTTQVWGLTRNRSLGPHVRNSDLADARDEPQRTYANINPDLHVIRVDAAAEHGGYEPLAATVVFSVHGTGVPSHSKVYNADLWAYLTDELSGRIVTTTGTRPVVGAIEGTHADIAPALHPGTAGHLEAERIGRAIGTEAAHLYDSLEGGLTDRVTLAAGLREVNLARDRTIGSHRLPRRPAVGAALVAGAFENETPVVRHIPPFKPGVPRRRPSGAQGVKRVLGGPLQRLILPLADFPRIVPLQVLRIGDAALVGLPFEMTVTTGRRIAAAVGEQVTSSGVGKVIVSSVANEYAGYCATPEEYELQHYEGGHTLYGPQSQPFFAAKVAALAADTVRDGHVSDVATERAFDLRHRRYLPASGSGSSTNRQVLGRAAFTDATAATDPCWRQEWRDVPPGDLTWHEPLVRVEVADGHGYWRPNGPLGDGSCDIEVVHLGQEHEGDRYAVRWHNPDFHGSRRHRFVLLADAGRPEVACEPFS
jgi:neutral ceramidase